MNASARYNSSVGLTNVPKKTNSQLPPIGTALSRDYHGANVKVTVQANGNRPV